MRNGEIACNKQFLLFSQCFLPYMTLIFHFECILKCRLQFVSIWTSLKFCPLTWVGITCRCIEPPFHRACLIYIYLTGTRYTCTEKRGTRGCVRLGFTTFDWYR